MCGRFTNSTPPKDIAKVFDVPEPTFFEPRYNIAPTQLVPAVRVDAETQQRAWNDLRWGLIPSWADDPKIGNRMINARAETVAEKPAFRSAFKKRRCLIPADGFYEWQKTGTKKQPYHIGLKDGAPFAFAGLWEEWEVAGELIASCTIITTEANEIMRPLHDRMPVILDPGDYSLWLDPAMQSPEKVKPLLKPFASERMKAYPVSTFVNNPRHDDPRCKQEVEPAPD